jgi:hypothetical protein
MKLMSLLLIVFSANVYAQSNEEVGFTYWGYEGRNRSFLSCHYVEGASESILRELDATDVNVRCSGGIEFNTYSPVRASAKFVLPVQEQIVKVKSDFGANCYFDTTFIEEIARASDRIEIVSGSTHCFRPDSRYNITLKIK